MRCGTARHGLQRFGVLAAVLLLAATAPAWADFVFLHDGYTLYGTLRKEGDLIRDEGLEVWAPKVGWVMDDGVRRVYFHQRLVAEVEKDPPDFKPNVEVFRLKQPYNGFQGAIRNISIDAAGPWLEGGKRFVEVTPRADMRLNIDQFLIEAAPSRLVATARTYRWQMRFMPSEIKPADLFMILRTHDDGIKKDPESIESLGRLFRYSVEAGWLDEAEKLRQKLKPLLKESNATYERLDKELDRRLALRADQQVQLAVKAGQHLRAQQLLDAARDDGASDAVLARLRSARAKYKQQSAELESLRRSLARARKGGKAPTLLTAAGPVLDEIERDLNLDNCGRLEVFLRLARQEERLRETGKSATTTDDQLLSLAVSGWLLGSKGAESREVHAIQLCQARDFLLRYLKATDKAERDRLLYAYTRNEGLRVDEIAQLLELLPPVEPDATPPGGLLRRTTPPSEHWKEGVSYQVQRPAECHPHRAYPVLVVLPNTRPTAGDVSQLQEWYGPLADRYGCLLVFVDWLRPGQKTFENTPKEHAAVHEVLRDLRRHDNVDGERITLAGFDESAMMCYEVALAKPDQFAAVVILCGLLGQNSLILQNNAQYLPFYLVDGEKDYERPKQSRRLFEYWMGRGFPSLYCEYFTRGYEDYHHELPFIFDWFTRKQVAKGLPDLGRETISNLGEPFRSIRPSDNRFYWLSSSAMNCSPKQPAELYAKQLAGNSFQIKTRGFSQISVWLSPAMVDFEQPVEIRVNPGGNGPTFKKVVKPSLEVMLEDFYARGDRRSLYFARVDFDLSRR